jgi:hypothetical protein
LVTVVIGDDLLTDGVSFDVQSGAKWVFIGSDWPVRSICRRMSMISASMSSGSRWASGQLSPVKRLIDRVLQLGAIPY